MSRTSVRGGLHSCTRSIQTPDRSVRASRLASIANHSVSKRPIWLLDAAARSRPSRPTNARIEGSPASRSASLIFLVAGEPTQHRLAEQPAQLVARVLATAAV